MLLSARLYGIPRAERTERISRALTRMGLLESAHHLAGHYSGGMIRRLEIAQSFLHRPAVLFLDEPTVGLDPGARETVWEHVLDLRDRFNRTMIVTSHHLDEINEFCDRIALIDRGRIAAIGTPSELKARVGPDATLDDVFIGLVAAGGETETEGSYGPAGSRQAWMKGPWARRSPTMLRRPSRSWRPRCRSFITIRSSCSLGRSSRCSG
jgi:ABC-2 type transport system ATP-binding protein